MNIWTGKEREGERERKVTLKENPFKGIRSFKGPRPFKGRCTVYMERWAGEASHLRPISMNARFDGDAKRERRESESDGRYVFVARTATMNTL